ncbi:MAG TPA: hypothetical protein VF834_15065 [Streptosporangiaceae bacterium]
MGRPGGSRKLRRQQGDLPVSAFPWARVFALLTAMLVSALVGVALAPIFAGAAPVAVLAGNSAGAVATSLAVSLTARPASAGHAREQRGAI